MDAIPDAVADQSAATKLVYVYIRANEPVSQSQLVAQTAISGRTVRTATNRLEATDQIVVGQPVSGEGKRRVYRTRPD